MKAAAPQICRAGRGLCCLGRRVVRRTSAFAVVRRTSAFAVVALPAIIVCPAAYAQTPAQPARQGQAPVNSVLPTPLITEGVTFAPVMQFDKGQERRYGAQSSLTFRFPGRNGGPSTFASTSSMTLTLHFRARETRPDGSVIVQALFEGGRILDATGAFQNIARDPENTPRLLTLDRQDRLIAFKDAASKRPTAQGGGLDALFNQSNLLIPLAFLPLPDKTVNVGESWTARYATPSSADTRPRTKARSSGALDNASEDASNGASDEDVTATLTLLGREKIGATDTIKIKQVLTVPYTAYTDAQGKPTDARSAKGRIAMRLTFTQLENALPESGLMVRSQGQITGTVQFAGALLAQLPGDTMTVSGRLLTLRLEDTPPTQAPAAQTPPHDPR